MIIWVHDVLFSKERHDLDLLTLFRNVADRRHTLLIATHPNAPRHRRAAPCFDQWLETLPASLQSKVRLIRKQVQGISANASVRNTTRLLVAARKLPDGVEDCEISLAEAVRAAAQPLYLLVEDQINDAAFLRQVMSPRWRRKMEQWEKNGQLRYENGGGIDSMRRLVKFYAQDEKARLAFGLPTKLWWLTHFIIFDHDGDVAERPSASSKDVMKLCKNANLLNRCHRLERRTQENYIPKEAMQVIAEYRLTDVKDREKMLDLIDHHYDQSQSCHFKGVEK
ncbi:MAG: hypothetical protein D3903_10305 [Candidatus Electrothrix sp. GM3_4]|nr:hypothetical protein [Candidatus Electrothrix sp. GM3_4]